MKVIDAITMPKYCGSNHIPVSFEIIPPVWNGSASAVKEQSYRIMESLMTMNPAFVSVTYHQSSRSHELRRDGAYTATIENPRPGTIALCSKLEGKFGVPMVQHLVCGGFTTEETAVCIGEIAYNLDNVFVIRGDPEKGKNVFIPTKGGHRYASDLVRQVAAFNKGEYMQGNARVNLKTDLCIGVAGYPEIHAEAPDAEFDLGRLKDKIEAGAHYIITQMFFNNEVYFRFAEQLKLLGVAVPVIPATTPFLRPDDIFSVPKPFNARVPSKTRKRFYANPCIETSIDCLVEQLEGLIKKGVPGIHLFTESNPNKIAVITEAYKRIFKV